MKILGSLIAGIAAMIFLMNPISSGEAVETPGNTPDDVRPGKLRPGESIPPDLAVIELFFNAQCQLHYTVKNKGGKIDPLLQYGMGVKICGRDNQCLSNVQNLDALTESGSQKTFTCVPAKPVLIPPYTITIFPPFQENKSNNSLTRDIQCSQGVN